MTMVPLDEYLLPVRGELRQLHKYKDERYYSEGNRWILYEEEWDDDPLDMQQVEEMYPELLI